MAGLEKAEEFFSLFLFFFLCLLWSDCFPSQKRDRPAFGGYKRRGRHGSRESERAGLEGRSGSSRPPSRGCGVGR